MKVISLRIISLVLLVMAVLSLSGIVTTAEALVHAGEAAPCCDNDSRKEGPETDPCSVPDCPCAFCLTIDVAHPPTVSRNTDGTVNFKPGQQRVPLSEFFSPIEYPPEAS